LARERRGAADAAHGSYCVSELVVWRAGPARRARPRASRLRVHGARKTPAITAAMAMVISAAPRKIATTTVSRNTTAASIAQWTISGRGSRGGSGRGASSSANAVLGGGREGGDLDGTLALGLRTARPGGRLDGDAHGLGPQRADRALPAPPV